MMMSCKNCGTVCFGWTDSIYEHRCPVCRGDALLIFDEVAEDFRINKVDNLRCENR